MNQSSPACFIVTAEVKGKNLVAKLLIFSPPPRLDYLPKPGKDRSHLFLEKPSLMLFSPTRGYSSLPPIFALRSSPIPTSPACVLIFLHLKFTFLLLHIQFSLHFHHRHTPLLLSREKVKIARVKSARRTSSYASIFQGSLASVWHILDIISPL